MTLAQGCELLTTLDMNTQRLEAAWTAIIAWLSQMQAGLMPGQKLMLAALPITLALAVVECWRLRHTNIYDW